jgi:hypothetical protein
MKRKPLTTMSCCLLGSILVIASLYHFTPGHHQKNGFLRTFAKREVILPIDTLELGYDSYYVAGHGRGTLFLGSVVAPRHVVAITIPTLDSSHLMLEIVEPKRFLPSSIQVAVDSPFVYLCDGTVPAIYRGYLLSLKVYPLNVAGIYFLDIMPRRDSSFVLRSLDMNKENVLALLKPEGFRFQFSSYDLTRQVDGLFCTSGKLLYDRQNDHTVYVYTYRNKYVVLDSALSQVAQGKTIDTVSRARIKVTTVKSTNTVAIAQPSVVVNKSAAVHRDLLFINSGKMADNDDPAEFDEHSAIDVYQLSNRRYLFTFYIPGKSVREIVLFEKHAIALYEDKVVLFRTFLD